MAMPWPDALRYAEAGVRQEQRAYLQQAIAARAARADENQWARWVKAIETGGP